MKSTFRLCLADMNNGHPNQASRCFRLLADDLFTKVRAKNPKVACEYVVVHPRNLHDNPPDDCDLYLSSGGPGGPFDHDGEPWLAGYKAFLDRIVERTIKHGPAQPSLLGVCYSFELLVRHFEVAQMVTRSHRKFGVMPVYMTEAGTRHALTGLFGDRLFAFEHRNWEAVDPDEKKIKALGGALLAQESRDGVSKGRGLLAFDFAPGVEGTQFHPEADKMGVIAWLQRREQAAAFIEAYGHVTYERMIRTLDNPERLARTFTVFIPGWLARKFNLMAEDNGWAPLDSPSLDAALFAGEAPTASSIVFPSLLPSSTPKPSELDFDDVVVPFETGLRPLQEELRPLQHELDPAAVGESVLAACAPRSPLSAQSIYRGGDRHAGFSVEAMPARGALRIHCWGFWGEPLAAEDQAALRDGFTAFGGRRFGVLLDASDSPVQRPEVAAVRAGLMREATALGMDRILVFRAGPSSELQLRRLAAESGIPRIEFVATEIEAFGLLP